MNKVIITIYNPRTQETRVYERKNTRGLSMVEIHKEILKNNPGFGVRKSIRK